VLKLPVSVIAPLTNDLRLAAVLGPSIFTLGAAAGHVNQMITAHSFAPGNAGIIFWTDILISLSGFALLRLSRRGASPRAAPIAACLT
jgi:hypothetical protein